MQNEASRVLETRNASTRRLARVHDAGEVAEPPGQRQVGDVHAPHVPGPDDLEVSQQVGLDLVTGSRLGETAGGKEGLDAHAAHERRDVLAANL